MNKPDRDSINKMILRQLNSKSHQDWVQNQEAGRLTLQLHRLSTVYCMRFRDWVLIMHIFKRVLFSLTFSNVRMSLDAYSFFIGSEFHVRKNMYNKFFITSGLRAKQYSFTDRVNIMTPKVVENIDVTGFLRAHCFRKKRFYTYYVIN